MADGQMDPARLSGEALRRWYLRTPDEIERERQAAASRRHADFFGGLRWRDPDPDFALQPPERNPDPGFGIPAPPNPDPGFGIELETSRPGMDPGFSWTRSGPDRWRRDRVPDLGRGARPVPMPPVALGPRDEWSRPVPMPFPPVPTGGSRPVPLALHPSNSFAPPVGFSKAAQAVRSMPYGSNQAAAPDRAKQQASSAPRGRHGIWIAGRQPGELDPSRTDVFQRGPDGKLHPVPGWRTTGPFDFGDWSRMFDWGGVAGDLTDITTGALDFMGGGGLVGQVVKGLGYKIGPDVVRGIINGHHSWPKFLGGPSEQDLARLHRSLHVDFHVDLEAALKQAGFPRVGGRGGGTADWAEYFRLNPGKQDEAIEILQRVTRDFDKKNGTKISKYLDGTLAKGNAPPSSPSP